jgi:hypothetical protein
MAETRGRCLPQAALEARHAESEMPVLQQGMDVGEVMPRGFKKDITGTKIGKFEDKRSFVSQQKFILNGCQNLNHIIAYGKDKAPIRAEIFRRNREANGGFCKCWKCGLMVYELVYADVWNMPLGQWDHVRNKDGERCDCPENGRVSCEECHTERHVRPRWGAAKDVRLV